MPKDRQILMFSATFPVTVKDFKKKYLNKPYTINLMDEALTLMVCARCGRTTCAQKGLPVLNRLLARVCRVSRNTMHSWKRSRKCTV